MNAARFEVEVTASSALAFAELSGDWNPLHTDPVHAARTSYQRPVLHGAFAAGLVSRMAGMYLPGSDCLLHSMRLRFLAPIVTPARLIVDGAIVADSGMHGRTDVTITDADSGVRYVSATYEFGRHEIEAETAATGVFTNQGVVPGEPVILVTGASGALGREVCEQLGARAIGLTRGTATDLVSVANLEALQLQVSAILRGRPLAAIVHCAWPAPDNVPLTAISSIETSVEHFVAGPLRQMISLAQVLKQHGTSDASLVLIGSTFAAPGRHNYRMPLYSLGKSLIPELSRMLAVDLGATSQRCTAIVFDVIDAGMNKRLTKSARLAHADRTPSGNLPTAADAAEQVRWVLENRSSLVSGAVISLSGGALP